MGFERSATIRCSEQSTCSIELVNTGYTLTYGRFLRNSTVAQILGPASHGYATPYTTPREVARRGKLDSSSTKPHPFRRGPSVQTSRCLDWVCSLNTRHVAVPCCSFNMEEEQPWNALGKSTARNSSQQQCSTQEGGREYNRTTTNLNERS